MWLTYFRSSVVSVSSSKDAGSNFDVLSVGDPLPGFGLLPIIRLYMSSSRKSLIRTAKSSIDPGGRVIRLFKKLALSPSKSSTAAVRSILRKRRFGLPPFHLRKVASKFDSGGRDRGLELFVLGFELCLIFVGPDPNKFVLRLTHPGVLR